MTMWSFVGFVVFPFFPKTHIQLPSRKEFKTLTPSLFKMSEDISEVAGVNLKLSKVPSISVRWERFSFKDGSGVNAFERWEAERVSIYSRTLPLLPWHVRSSLFMNFSWNCFPLVCTSAQLFPQSDSHLFPFASWFFAPCWGCADSAGPVPQVTVHWGVRAGGFAQGTAAGGRAQGLCPALQGAILLNFLKAISVAFLNHACFGWKLSWHVTGGDVAHCTYGGEC